MGIRSSRIIEPTPAEASESMRSISSHRIPIVQSHIEAFETQTEGTTTYFTAADFRHVRRIRFSTEKATDSRYLTGLLLEYQDTRGARNTAVVGQWLRETDSLDLAEGDNIVHIRIWYSQGHTRELSEFLKVVGNNGRLVGIQISTAKGLRKEVRFDGSGDTYFVDYYANRLQDLVSQHGYFVEDWGDNSI